MKLPVATACVLVICGGCAAARHTSHVEPRVLVEQCSGRGVLIDPSHPRVRHVPGPVLTARATERAFGAVGLRLRPISVAFFWRGPGIRPYPEAAFRSAASTASSKRLASLLVAVYPGDFEAFTAALEEGPNRPGSCETHRRVANVLLNWSGHEDSRLRAAIGRLR